MYYFHKKLKVKKPKKNHTKKNFSGFFLVGLFGFFGWVFLGGFFWVGFYCQPCLDEVLHDVAARGLVGDDGGGEIAQDPGAGRLDGVEVLLLVQEQLDDQVATLKKII